MTCDKCLWNISLRVRREFKPSKNVLLPSKKNRRLPSYLRDVVTSQKLGKKEVNKPIANRDLFSEIKNFDEYFPSKNITTWTKRSMGGFRESKGGEDHFGSDESRSNLFRF